MGSKTQPTELEVNYTTLKQYIDEHKRWSEVAFGQGDHLEGLLKHIVKEVEEVREVAGNSKELAAREIVDIIILAIDALWRLGLYPDEITFALIEKQKINMARKWPKITDPNEPTEHIRDEANGT